MKTKLTTRAVTAHSMPSPCAIRQTASTSRTRRRITGRIRHQLRLAGAALLLACVPFGLEAAQVGRDYGHFAMPGSIEGGGASATAGGWVDVRDLQNRATVKLNVRDQGVYIGPRN